jgi:hypothetical protein
MRIGRRNRSTRRKPAPIRLCPPQFPHDLSRARTRAAAVASRRLTARPEKLVNLYLGVISWALCSLSRSGVAIILIPKYIQNHMLPPFPHFFKIDKKYCKSNFYGIYI